MLDLTSEIPSFSLLLVLDKIFVFTFMIKLDDKKQYLHINGKLKYINNGMQLKKNLLKSSSTPPYERIICKFQAIEYYRVFWGFF